LEFEKKNITFFLMIKMQEEGTLKIDYFVVYKLMLGEHPVALLDLR
jgi:hypothetical protein